jgi:hypothetical protein
LLILHRWENVGRILAELKEMPHHKLDPGTPNHQAFKDCTMRFAMCISDTNGLIEEMEMDDGYNANEGVTFGTDVLRAAEDLVLIFVSDE